MSRYETNGMTIWMQLKNSVISKRNWLLFKLTLANRDVETDVPGAALKAFWTAPTEQSKGGLLSMTEILLYEILNLLSSGNLIKSFQSTEPVKWLELRSKTRSDVKLDKPENEQHHKSTIVVLSEQTSGVSLVNLMV